MPKNNIFEDIFEGLDFVCI